MNESRQGYNEGDKEAKTDRRKKEGKKQKMRFETVGLTKCLTFTQETVVSFPNFNQVLLVTLI